MSLTNAFTAKRAIIRRLESLVAAAGETSPLFEVQVGYGEPGPPDSEVQIFGADSTFNRVEDEDLVDGADEANAELAFVNLIIRAAVAPTPVDGVAITDQIIEAIANQIDELLRAERDIAGPQTYADIVDGRVMNRSDEERAVSSMIVRIGVESYLTGER